jgi:hypothetical protein
MGLGILAGAADWQRLAVDHRDQSGVSRLANLLHK